jgi:hypothetical protein
LNEGRFADARVDWLQLIAERRDDARMIAGLAKMIL